MAAQGWSEWRHWAARGLAAAGTAVIVPFLSLWLAGTAAAQDRIIQPADPLFLPQMGQFDDRDEPEAVSPPAAPLVDAATVRRYEQAMVGKPVYGYRTGRLGVVVDLAINGRGQPTVLVVRLDSEIDPRQSNLPVLWIWARGQLDAPTLVVPWSAAQVAWLVKGEGR